LKFYTSPKIFIPPKKKIKISGYAPEYIEKNIVNLSFISCGNYCKIKKKLQTIIETGGGE